MNVVFWGEEHGSGTTAHMLAVAGMLAVMCPKMKIAVGTSPKEEQAAIHFYDGGTGLTRRKRRMLWRADLVVVSLKQERNCMERFFQRDFHISENLFFLLDGYAGEVETGRIYLEQVYRIEPERIGAIPFNNEFYLALLRGESGLFIRRECRNHGNISNQQFIRELKRTAAYIMGMTEEIRRSECADRDAESRSKGQAGRKKETHK